MASKSVRYLDNSVAVPNVKPAKTRIPGPNPTVTLDPNPKERQVFKKTSDGRILFDNLEERPGIPHGFQLPVAPTKDELKAQELEQYVLSTEGYTPIVSGPITNLSIDGEDWSKRINEDLEKNGLGAFPKAPFVVLVVGSIAAGKTSMLKRLIEAMVHPNRFKKVVIGSKSLGLDPITKEAQLMRDPECEYIFKNRITVKDFADQHHAVEAYLRPWSQLADEGFYKKEQQISNKKWHEHFYLRTNVNADLHPFIDREGRFHGQLPKFKDWSGQRSKGSKYDVRNYDTLETYYLKEMVPMTSYVSEKYIEGKRLHIQEKAINAVLSYPTAAAAAAQLKRIEDGISNPGLLREHKEPSPVLYIWEDGAYATKGQDAVQLAEYMTIIRHLRASAVILIQQKSAAFRIIRTIATDVFIFGIKNEQEMKSIEDEYGGTVSNFRQKYYAATHKIDEMGEKDFMNIPLRERDVCYRSHQGRIEAIKKIVNTEEPNPANLLPTKAIKHAAEEDPEPKKRKSRKASKK
jgi:hypothetical protein